MSNPKHRHSKIDSGTERAVHLGASMGTLYHVFTEDYVGIDFGLGSCSYTGCRLNLLVGRGQRVSFWSCSGGVSKVDGGVFVETNA